jgi:hypothetical protein
MEFALGLDPKSHDAGGVPSDSIVQDNGHDYLSLTFKRWQKAPGLHYSVEVSSDLVTWAPAGEIVAVVDLGDGRETVTIRDNLPISSTNTQRFLRLVVAHL